MLYQVIGVYAVGPSELFGTRRFLSEAKKLAVFASRLNPLARFKVKAVRTEIEEDTSELPPELWIRR